MQFWKLRTSIFTQLLILIYITIVFGEQKILFYPRGEHHLLRKMTIIAAVELPPSTSVFSIDCTITAHRSPKNSSAGI